MKTLENKIQNHRPPVKELEKKTKMQLIKEALSGKKVFLF